MQRMITFILLSLSSSLYTADKKNDSQHKFDPLNLISKDPWSIIGDYTGHITLSLATKRILQANDKNISCVAWNPDGMSFASAGGDLRVRIWDAKTHACLNTITHTSTLYSVAYDPHATLLVAAGKAPTFCLWDIQKGKQRSSWNHKHGRSCYRAVFDRAGQRIASAGTDMKMCIWDLQQQQPLATMNGEQHSYISDICWLRDPFLCISTDTEGKTHLWDIRTKKPEELGCCDTDCGGHQIACTADDTLFMWPNKNTITYTEYEIVVWDRKANKQLKSIKSKEHIKSVQLNANEQTVLSALLYGSLYVFDRESGSCVEHRKIIKANECLTPASWSPDEQSILVADSGGNIHHLEQPDLLSYLSSADKS
jgi:WD40 repeat protein